MICKECVDTLFREWCARFDEKTALIGSCALLDIPYIASAYQSVITNNSTFTIGLYNRLLNTPQYKGKTFINTLVEGELERGLEDVRNERQSRWLKADRQNKAFVLSTCGYDPFDGLGLTDNDQKYCYNILAGYCDTDGIREDNYKLQSVIEMAQLQLQCKKINEMLNSELLLANPDSKRAQGLTDTKAKLLSSISGIAKDNNIASAYNKNATAGQYTLGQKMKEMFADGYHPVEQNLFDVKTCEAMKQIADLSNRSILEELALDANDYTSMIVEQREKLLSLQDKINGLEEDLRQTKNELAVAKAKK